MSDKYQLDELPYKHSPKLEWVGQTSVAPAVGSFTFTGTLAIDFTPLIPLKPRALYFLDDMDFNMNTSAIDFDGAVTTNPKLVFQESSGGVPVLRYPLELPSFLDKAPIRQYFYPQAEPNFLQFRFSGVVAQTMALAGLATLKATIIIRAYEITQPLAIEAILRGFENPPRPPAPQAGGPRRVPVMPETPLMPGVRFRG
jgi:hypothetical protein